MVLVGKGVPVQSRGLGGAPDMSEIHMSGDVGFTGMPERVLSRLMIPITPEGPVFPMGRKIIR